MCVCVCVCVCGCVGWCIVTTYRSVSAIAASLTSSHDMCRQNASYWGKIRDVTNMVWMEFCTT